MSEREGEPAGLGHASDLPRAHGEPVLSARFRCQPEDFRVDELPSFAATGEGEHLLLTIEKRGMNTSHVAGLLAKWGAIPEMGVGYAGMKDRHAVTTQRFSVHFPKRVSPDVAALQGDGLRVLEYGWHNRKLSRGALAGNRFELLLQAVEGDRAEVENRLVAIREQGIANYFGVQRFGHGGDNVDAARRMFAGQRMRREQRSIFLSAARSEIFNAVLAARIRAGNWNLALAGDVWMLDGTQSIFGPEPVDEAIVARIAAQDLHPTGPMWGTGELRTRDDARDIEASATEGFADLRSGLESAGMKQERRALRVRVRDLSWQWPAKDALRVGFTLMPGAYATEVLAELGPVADASRD
jgi:tRNA pseudouridine13 synthase